MPLTKVSGTGTDELPRIENLNVTDSIITPTPSLLLDSASTDHDVFPSSSGPFKAPPYLIIHRVECTGLGGEGEDHRDHPSSADFFDVPRLFAQETRGSALRGKLTLPPYYEAPPEFYMVVYRMYSCSEYHKSIKDAFELVAVGIDKQLLSRLRPWYYMLQSDGPPATMSGEKIEFTSEAFSTAMKAIVASKHDELPEWTSDRNLRSPYDYFYHFRHLLREQSTIVLSGLDLDMVEVLLDYIDDTQGPGFDEVDANFAAGNVNFKDFAKLFRPNGIFTTTRDGYSRAYIAEHALLFGHRMLRLSCWTWTFDGSFRKKPDNIVVPWPDFREEQVPIASLVAQPLRLDKSGLEQRLEERGRSFWSCRHRKFVSYDAPIQTIFELQTTNPKYMIDVNTYRQMHPKNFITALATDAEMKEQGVDMSIDEPPSKSFCILLPATMLGYAFHDKKWRSLAMEHIGPVTWNKEAFSRLVLKPKKKELIRALVTVHLTSKQAADVIEDKGNGLIILLHGSPGTGKTLTAESVAEIAEKPLYRVTCGDIGTDAEGVEKYLESVLLVGTIWDCVVLLDEADVFLEERQVTDLARNALVSVFLRVLEYYNGILVLTSNRVGTFDEAFKSRVQLAVHYPVLDEDGRFEIWSNFIRTLKDRNVDMAFSELDRKIPLLARNKLNGRQIRNLVWTAGQLAKYKKERLEYTHLEQVIEIANEFEEYLEKTHGHTDEEYAQAQGTRTS